MSLTPYIDQVSEQEWNDLLPRFADASIYQSWAYGAIHWGRKQLSHMVLRRDGEVVAAAQLRIVQLPVIRKGVAYVRWGPMWRRFDRPQNPDPQILRQALEALKEEYVRKRGLMLRVIPNVFQTDTFASSCSSHFHETGFEQHAASPAYRTIRIDLSHSIEDLRKGLHQRWRNKLKNAEKTGFTVSTSTSQSDYARFQLAYDEMMSRKHFETTVDPAEFARLQPALPETLKMRVLFCELDGKLYNALVVAQAGESGIYLLAATANDGLQANGAFLLQWRAIQMLKQAGCRWYDLGGVNSQRNPGVYQFKSGMGGVEAEQLGMCACSSDWFTSVCVAAGESLKSIAEKARKVVAPKPQLAPVKAAVPA